MDSDKTPADHQLVSYSFAVPATTFQSVQHRLSGEESVWLRDGYGLLGFGSLGGASALGADRFKNLRSEWRKRVAETHKITDPESPWLLTTPGVGLVAFSAMAFADNSERNSILRIPQLVLGHRLADDKATGFSADTNHSAARSWLTWVLPQHHFTKLLSATHALDSEITTVDPAEPSSLTAAHHTLLQRLALEELERYLAVAPSAVEQRFSARLELGWVSDEQYVRSVEEGLRRLSAGEAKKLVLSRDAVVTTEQDIPVKDVLTQLTARYRQCWTYSVADGAGNRLLGSTPEMLIKSQSGYVSARLLAGTLDRVGHEDDTDYPVHNLLRNDKQRVEHQFAIDSLTGELGAMVRKLHAPQEPFLLELPNVWHLASDVSAELTAEARASGCAIMDLVERVHPTAAVCGTPTPVAQKLIEELEGYDRGWYAGPVGWLDDAGNGEFGIALRGGILETARQLRLFAGCGIVVGSDAQTELAETYAKLRPMLQAVGLD